MTAVGLGLGARARVRAGATAAGSERDDQQKRGYEAVSRVMGWP